jgi:putative Mn2+ efflux pump MntP
MPRMTFIEVLILALALSADAFTVGASVGLKHSGRRQLFRLSFHFGLFQSLLTLAGALVGTLFLRYVEAYDHWLVLAVLTLVGVHMIYSGLRGGENRAGSVDLTRGLTLIGLSLAVSIDAFGAGIGLPAARAPLVLSVVLIGLVSAAATLAAMLLADRVKTWAGRPCEIGAGVVLIGLGVWTVLDHLHILVS